MTMKNVAIVDYKMGNLFSVNQACLNVGLRPLITNNPQLIKESDAIILPGVGSFGEAMQNLTDLNLIDTIKKVINDSKPFLGVCLGFQLLFSESEEFGITKGLEVFEGKVKKFSGGIYQNRKIKVPQIGWNQIIPYDENKWERSLMNSVNFGEYMYFVHSFYVETKRSEIMLTKTYYEGYEYCSSIQFKNLFASQFHPEKSAKEGLKVYKNFAKIINEGIKYE